MGMLTSLAVRAADAATWASKKTGRGSGGMIGGLVANFIDPKLMEQLGAGRPCTIVTGTNGKSTTTRMLAEAVRALGTVATNDGGDNMDAGVISALLAGRDRERIVLEVDELHVPAIAKKLDCDVLVLLNLSRDQLDRVGEINKIERVLRECVEARPGMTVVANCDDVQVTSVAWDCPNVVWVSAGVGFTGDSTSCPRTGGAVVRTEEQDGSPDWYAVKPLADGREFRRPTPTWTVTPEGLTTPSGELLPLSLKLPGNANRGNATQAIAAAVALGVDETSALAAAERVDDVAGRYSTVNLDGREVHLLLAKNPAGWQEALSMVDRAADGLVIAVNGQVADGQDLSWLWDVKFENLDDLKVVAAGERSSDLAVRLGYAGVEHDTVADTVAAVRACPPGRVEVLANYTAFRDLRKDLQKEISQ
ncbi:MAG: MurT ligase domain-containing protein [Corynebacterium sp.]|uniref:MurT ligase domain-containing protein n=1 Tax=unclassified Corynebacterium TaxID=2624378 RepID=UPI002649785F|nr:MurT ligase domain-containing protein [Corynebacterium sp.]MDN5581114.1 MurT ligase domain-containing protein [Corynebacterium sp.]MDN5720684.1 MurT ligase domain-containing protein [Corynebacterium sp.]MDN6324765.1 MurT ligase domain-containing protein [Corynebacterium sp.]MDN6509985.1 MurT ligase domain-containing protein [Corynebacterium sp.]